MTQANIQVISGRVVFADGEVKEFSVSIGDETDETYVNLMGVIIEQVIELARNT